MPWKKCLEKNALKKCLEKIALEKCLQKITWKDASKKRPRKKSLEKNALKNCLEKNASKKLPWKNHLKKCLEPTACCSAREGFVRRQSLSQTLISAVFWSATKFVANIDFTGTHHLNVYLSEKWMKSGTQRLSAIEHASVTLDTTCIGNACVIPLWSSICKYFSFDRKYTWFAQWVVLPQCSTGQVQNGCEA